MSGSFFSRFSHYIGIDLGSQTIRIWSSDGGVALAEPGVIAVDQRLGKVIAAGLQAQAMQGRVSEHIVIASPIQGGKIHDPALALAMMRFFLQRVFASKLLVSPTCMATLPSSATLADRQLVTELLQQLGARESVVIAQPLAAAIGAGVPIADSSGCFLVQLGESVIEGAIISLGSMVKNQATDLAGAYLRRRIQHVLKLHAGLVISAQTAEMVLKQVVSVVPGAKRQQLVTGQDLQQGSPKELVITSEVFAEVMAQVARRYEQLVRRLLAQVPPELTVDTLDKGILLSGGLAQLYGLDHYLVKQLGVPVSVVDEPSLSVIKGVGTALSHYDQFRDSLG